MNTNLMFSSKNQCWCTPQDFFDRLNSEFHFVLDAAATAKSAKCSKYFTPEIDALAQNWGIAGGAVYCNPPYGRNLGNWVQKAKSESEQHRITVVMLIPVRTDTRYWQDFILYGRASEIRFVSGRLRFTDEDGIPAAPAPFPSAVVIFRPQEVPHDASS